MTRSVSLPSPSVIRCSDTDRERTSEQLRDAAAEGRLRMDELEDRLGEVYSARHQHELDVLVADLPVAGRPAHTGGWRAVLAAIWAQLGVELTLLLGRGGTGWTRRRVVLTALIGLVLIAAVLAAVPDVD